MQKQKKEERHCVECASIFEVTKSNPKKFCNKSCSTKFNNKMGKTGRGNGRFGKERRCLNCGFIFDKTNKHWYKKKYCNRKCQGEFSIKQTFKLIEGGDISLDVRHYKRFLISKHGEKCMKCGWCVVNPYSKTIPIELNHIDGNHKNNCLENLELICPNHHSLTSTYKSLNFGNGREFRRKT